MKTLKGFVQDWRSWVVLSSLVALGGWIFSRVWMVNPAILGDEYLYSLNARKASPWEPALAGDFSNYLFNFVYQSTNLCGTNFYQCGKVLNIVFYLGFIFILFLVARRFVSFWLAYAFMVFAALSPLSVYTSMFLPESMYFFFIGLILLSVLRALGSFSWQNWALVGLALGTASLVKPHAWLSALAIGITLIVVGLTQRGVGFRGTLLSGISLVGSAVASRFIVGFAVGGPKALGLFGVYVDSGTIQQVTAGPSADLPAEAVVGSSPIDGVFALFWPQLNIHALTLVALMGISLAMVMGAVFDLIRTRELSQARALTLLALIWLIVIMLEIVMFTGWVTGGGDDHTTRVLLRYYDFMFLVVPLAALAAAKSEFWLRLNTFIRWGLAAIFLGLLTPAFTGFFGQLTIQIADAPNLAGLVVNEQVFNATATIGFLGLLVFATFPRFTIWALLVTLPVTMVATGWQIQDQYQMFRGNQSAGDLAGKYLHEIYSDEELAEISIVANSRFDATNVGIWMDVPDIFYEVIQPGGIIPVDYFPEDRRIIVLVGEFGYALDGNYKIVYESPQFSVLDAR